MTVNTARNGRKVPVVLAVAAILIVAVVLLGSRAGGQAGGPTSAQTSLAWSVAHGQALATVPAPDGSPTPGDQVQVDTTGWPANVQSVSMTLMTHGAAKAYVGTLPDSDSRPVMVIQLTGEFSAGHSAPPGQQPYTTGQVLTTVVDASTGDVLDFGVDGLSSARILTHATTLFDRT